jgi:hypothetical protein
VLSNPLWGQSSERNLLPDLSIHSVDLDRVKFDTFEGSYISLSKISDKSILKLRDRIRPIYEPRFEESKKVRWLNPGDRVIVFPGKDKAKVYPLKILEFHEIVNDEIDGKPILVTYCPLCASGVVYDRRIEGGRGIFWQHRCAL